MTLEEIRNEIDRIDAQLLPLLMQRMDCAKEVAKVKKENHTPILNQAREEEILDRVEERAQEYGGEARVLYAHIMEMSRALQHRLLGSGQELRTAIQNASSIVPPPARVACLGKPGSFSHEALKNIYPNAEPMFFDCFADIFTAVEHGKTDLGLLPVENSSAGSVAEVYDLILKYRFCMVAAETLRVHLCLAAPHGVKEQDIRTVYSHPQPIAQCSSLLAELKAEAIPCSSTTAAAKTAANSGRNDCAVICSEAAAEAYGLHLLKREVQNNSNNCTRFIAISRNLFLPEDANKISLCFSLPHTTGSLNSVLSRFAAAGMNLTKIESRPIAGKTFEYDFYLDFSGNVREPKTLELLAALSDELPRFTFLGNYTELESSIER